MTSLLLSSSLVALTALAFWICRCRHDQRIPRQKRTPDGKPIYPVVLQWECFDCGAELGETSLRPKAKLIGWLRREAKARRVA